MLLTTGEKLDLKQKDVLHGTALRNGLSAPYHHHFFNIRLDTAVDGFNNSVYEVNCVPDYRTGIDNLQGNAFHRDKVQFKREWDAQRHISTETGRYWQIVNHSNKNLMGDHVSYRLVPSENSFPFLHPQSPVLKRAGFIRNHLWVTPFEPSEKYPSSMYPNKHQFEEEGLPQYTKKNRPIQDIPLVVWYNLGVLHIPRLEEWPIMSVTRANFWLLPDGFFNGNPSTYLKKPNTPDFDDKACNSNVKSKL